MKFYFDYFKLYFFYYVKFKNKINYLNMCTYLLEVNLEGNVKKEGNVCVMFIFFS